MTKEYWNQVFREIAEEERRGDEPRGLTKADNWLEDLLEYLPEPGARVLELGPGAGYDLAWLKERGYTLVAMDIADEALALARQRVPEATFVQGDVADGLPFEADSFDLVTSSLSLHYFPLATFDRIVGDIRRVLRPGGTFVFRVNSAEDLKGKPGEPIDGDPRYIMRNGLARRFYTGEEVRDRLAGWEILRLEHQETGRFKKGKRSWLAVARKPAG